MSGQLQSQFMMTDTIFCQHIRHSDPRQILKKVIRNRIGRKVRTEWYITLTGARGKGFYPLSVEGCTERGGPEGCPRHARWIPTREGVNHLHQELRPQVFTLLYVSFCANKWLRPADCVVTRSVTKHLVGCSVSGAWATCL